MKKLNMRNVAVTAAFIVVIAVLCFGIAYFSASQTTDRDVPPPETESETVSVTAPLTSALQTTLPPYTTSVNILENDQIVPLPDPITITVNETLWYLTLVNNQYRMPESYTVISAPAIPGSDVELDYRVAAAYTEMYHAAAAEGLYLTPYSGLRSYSRQKINYEYKTQHYLDQGYNLQDAKAKAAMVIMPPGCSEHNLGLAMDIIDTADNFYTTAEYAWLCEHAADYGFILRYPKEKQYITMVEYEPWHWRYVGVDFARAIKASGLCLEEYLQMFGLMPLPATEG